MSTCFRIRLVGICLVSFWLISPLHLSAQSDDCVDKDIMDVISKKGKNAKPEVIVINHPSIILFPVLGSAPATGFQFGAVGQAAWYTAAPETTRISQASANFTYTTKNQLLITSKSTVMTKQDRWIFVGDWRYYLYSQSTYGLGTNSLQFPPGTTSSAGISINGYDVSTVAGEEPMEFTWIRLHETALAQVKKNFYLGIGYHLDAYSSIKDKNLDIANAQLTNHFNYSVDKGFNPQQYSMSGFSANAVYDSRDNQINPFTGWYAKVQYRYTPTYFGSSKTGSLTWVELRGYKKLSSKNPRHLLAGWIFANWVNNGSIPYLGLPASSYDMRNTSSRGYVQGRFRGEDIAYAETEYRFPISKCTNILGGVVFVNAITASDRKNTVHMFDYIKPAYGFGLRIMADKLSRTNISIDVGVAEKTRGIYFGATEVF